MNWAQAIEATAVKWKGMDHKMNAFWKHYAEWKKPDEKVTYRMILFTWHYRQGKTIGSEMGSVVAKSSGWGTDSQVAYNHQHVHCWWNIIRATFRGDGGIFIFMMMVVTSFSKFIEAYKKTFLEILSQNTPSRVFFYGAAEEMSQYQRWVHSSWVLGCFYLSETMNHIID